MGACTEWYALIREAKYLGVAPWDLLEQPMVWREWVAEAMTAEAAAERAAQRRSEKRRR